MALKEVIPNGEAGEIAVLKAFRTKGRSLAPFGDAPLIRDDKQSQNRGPSG
jgi:hypothetical protein